jgi:hypothetical protein
VFIFSDNKEQAKLLMTQPLELHRLAKDRKVFLMNTYSGDYMIDLHL